MVVFKKGQNFSPFMQSESLLSCASQLVAIMNRYCSYCSTKFTFRNHFNIIIPSVNRLPKWTLPFRFFFFYKIWLGIFHSPVNETQQRIYQFCEMYILHILTFNFVIISSILLLRPVAIKYILWRPLLQKILALLFSNLMY